MHDPSRNDLETYYYAGGSKVELTDDGEHVAVDASTAPRAIMEALACGAAALSRLPGGMLIAPRSAIDDSAMAQLEQAGALLPVFRHEHAMLVLMAEVRVEMEGATQRAAVKQVLATSRHDVVVAQDSSDLLVLRPASGKPMDALAVANDIYERAHPAASSARFIQFLPRPGVKR